MSIQLTDNLLTTGPFLGILPSSMLLFGGKSLGLKALPVELPARPRSLAIITLKNRTLSPAAKLFIDCAREPAATWGRGEDQLRAWMSEVNPQPHTPALPLRSMLRVNLPSSHPSAAVSCTNHCTVCSSAVL